MDYHSVAWYSGGASIEIVLLNINPINRDLADLDIAVSDIRDEACRVVIALYASSVLRIDDNAVFERNVRDIVITLPAHRSDTQPVASRAIHIIHCNVVPAGDSHTIILIVNRIVVDQGVVSGADIESV